MDRSEGEAIRQQLAILRAQKDSLGQTTDAAELSSKIELEPEPILFPGSTRAG